MCTEKYLLDPSSPHASTPQPRHSFWIIGITTCASTSLGHRTSSVTCLIPATPTPAWNFGASTNNPHGKYSPTVTFHLTTLSLSIFGHTTSHVYAHACAMPPHVYPLRLLLQYMITPTAPTLSEPKLPLTIILPPLLPLQLLLRTLWYTHVPLRHHSPNPGSFASTSAPLQVLPDIPIQLSTLGAHPLHLIQLQLEHLKPKRLSRPPQTNRPPTPGPPRQPSFIQRPHPPGALPRTRRHSEGTDSVFLNHLIKVFVYL